MRITAQAAPVRQQVERALRDAITGGMLAPGRRLIERELCEQLGVSRPSVREAMRQLETEGLVQVQPNRGPVVASLSRQDAADVYGVRAVLEPAAARAFAVQAGEAEMAALLGAAASLDAAYATADVDAVLHAKAVFYAALFAGAGNRLLPRILGTITVRVTALRRVSLGTPHRMARSAAEIRRLSRAIRRRDAEASHAACLAHVRQAEKAALATFGLS